MNPPLAITICALRCGNTADKERNRAPEKLLPLKEKRKQFCGMAGRFWRAAAAATAFHAWVVAQFD
jgi:hypothetical protein